MCGGTVRVPLRVERENPADKPARRRPFSREKKGGVAELF